MLTTEADAFVSMLTAVATILADPASPPAIVRDSGDDFLVALANGANAEAIVTGDRDLLDHQGLTPAPARLARQAARSPSAEPRQSPRRRL